MTELPGRNPTYESVSAARSCTARSSLRTHGARTIDPNNPARIRQCRPTITFSSAVIAPNSRMFWNVRATPSFVMTSGRSWVMSRPENTIRPLVDL